MFHNDTYVTMRRRIHKGTLVGSTDKFRAIKAKRLIVEVLYSFRKGIIREKKEIIVIRGILKNFVRKTIC